MFRTTAAATGLSFRYSNVVEMDACPIAVGEPPAVPEIVARKLHPALLAQDGDGRALELDAVVVVAEDEGDDALDDLEVVDVGQEP